MLAIQKKLIEIERGCQRYFPILYSLKSHTQLHLTERDKVLCGDKQTWMKDEKENTEIFLCPTCEGTHKTLLQTTKECAENELDFLRFRANYLVLVINYDDFMIRIDERISELNQKIEFCEKELER
jgi:hypothetical protein